MSVAIVGHTGLVGGHLTRLHPDAEKFNSKNIEQIRGREFDALFLAGLPAEKWKANKFPEDDLKNVEHLIDCLKAVRAKKVTLFSTVDVFSEPVQVDENSTPKSAPGQEYGKHRLLFENFIRNHFAEVRIIRLPGLVGEGLKKNLIFDIKNNKPLSGFALESQFQFYPLERLGHDIEVVAAESPGVFHFAPEPVSVREVAETSGTPESLFASVSEGVVVYDFRTSRANSWGVSGPYQISKAESLEAIRSYVS
jgi:nucleoside-diphosphate-sugar epimerase